MKAKELLKGLEFSYDHFTKLTGTGISPDDDNIAQFAEDYLEYKLNLLGISVVGVPKGEQLSRCKCGSKVIVECESCMEGRILSSLES